VTPLRAAAGLAILVAAAAGTLGAQAVAGSTKLPVCRASQLRGSVLNSSGAAGTIALSVTLRNTGAACALRGYAGLQLRTAYRALPTRVLHGGLAFLNSTPKPVHLARSGKATILIAYSDVPVGSEMRCAVASRLAVRPPGQTGRLTVRATLAACGHGTLRESPVLAGARPVS
jgi:hypothetical protein